MLQLNYFYVEMLQNKSIVLCILVKSNTFLLFLILIRMHGKSWQKT